MWQYERIRRIRDEALQAFVTNEEYKINCSNEAYQTITIGIFKSDGYRPHAIAKKIVSKPRKR